MEARHQTHLHGVSAAHEYDRDGLCRALGRERGGWPRGEDHRDLAPDELSGKLRQSLCAAVGRAVLDRHVLALDEALRLSPCGTQRANAGAYRARGRGNRPPARRLLRARRERPRGRRAAKQRDELAPLSFDHLVGEQASSRAPQGRAPWPFEVDDELEFGRTCNRQVGRASRP